MSNHPPSRDTLQKATDAVVEFCLIAFQPEYCRWTKEINCGVASMMWNACRGGEEPVALGAPGEPMLLRLMETLARVRRTRWPDADFEVLGLDVHTERDEIVFTFGLTWDEGATSWPCEVTAEIPVVPSVLN